VHSKVVRELRTMDAAPIGMTFSTKLSDSHCWCGRWRPKSANKWAKFALARMDKERGILWE
jgi:hypothetical protein